jgi:ribonuclease BN (tRNA processing enzyme)
MKITCLGVNSAFAIPGYQTMFLLENVNGCGELKRMLIDCGSDVRFALHDAELTPLDIDAVYVSHLHADHIGGLEAMAFMTYFMNGQYRGEKADVPKPHLMMDANLMDEAWDQSLRGGLKSLQGIECSLETYFNVHRVAKSPGQFVWEGIHVQLVQTIHIVGEFRFRPSFGLILSEPEYTDDERIPEHPYKSKRIFITTDTQFAPAQLQDFYDKADIIIHDCETAPYKSRVHAHYTELAQLPDDTKKKIWLTHYQPDPEQDAVEDGFLGFAQKGQVIEL